MALIFRGLDDIESMIGVKGRGGCLFIFTCINVHHLVASADMHWTDDC